MKLIRVDNWNANPDEIDKIFVFETEPHWLFRLFGVKPKIVKYIGSCTVWYTYPGIRRCGTFLEAQLVEHWKRHEYSRNS